ncbi:class I SAM-dependent methyltransferase [Paenibacillus sp. ISL-20]|uniref:class I SAM-dependent methyltransferase n=1 Tax=Paenibacillus sp. ISL-20 TaxID=2819163 RepID=UPI001BEA9335|nr:class I SAM-dependent methyltransferase [Paenibacillus sp. ISL-20]MBT2764862.1 methyltransferase domain-containing protein [Paenibacillus sp. ISL-20]
MSVNHENQLVNTKVPIELLFTDFIPEEGTRDIPYFTERWYEHHKRFANKPVIRFSPHKQLYHYFMKRADFPSMYLDWYHTIFSSRNLVPPLSDTQIIDQRFVQYNIMKGALSQKQTSYFQQDPPLVKYNGNGGYFNLKDGHHRTAFLHCHGVKQVWVSMTQQDYDQWKNAEVLGSVLEVFQQQQRTLIYTPILHPSFMDLESERDDIYPTRLDLILEYLNATSVAGKKVIDIGCNIGYYARHFTREGAIVTGVEALTEHYELAQRLNHLERVYFDLRKERFETSNLIERYDIGLLLTVFYHMMKNVKVRDAFLRKINQTVEEMLFWESGDQPELEKAILLGSTHFDHYEKLGITTGTGKTRELGVFRKSRG